MSSHIPINLAQKKLADYCLTGQFDTLLKIPSHKLSVYRKLVFNGIHEQLITAYPITHSLLSQEQWYEMVKDFIANYSHKSPYIWRMPLGLYDFAKEMHYDERFSIPYLIDLLRFEWLEIEIYKMPDIDKQLFSEKGDLLNDQIYVNPEQIITIFSYPVFIEMPLPKATPQGEYPLLYSRHPTTGAIHFFALSPFYLLLLKLLKYQKMTGNEALTQAAKAFKIEPNKKLFSAGKLFLKDLFNQKAIYGFYK